MLTLRVILCPVDFSEQSQQALRWAQVLAARNHSRLVVLSVVDHLLAEAARAQYGIDLAKTETEPALREFVQSAAASLADVRVEYEVRVGEAAEVILDVAARQATDLIVMGTHGLGGVRKLLLGSTTARVLARTSTPVLGIPAAASAPDISPDPAASIRHLRVLAATDFSESSRAAVAWGAAFAEQFDLPLAIVHVVEPLTIPLRWRSYLSGTDEKRLADARAQLDLLAQECCAGRPCETLAVLGRTDEALTTIARERSTGLIVMGLTSEHDASGRRPGSVAYSVLRAASVPVLVIPPARA